ncbi:hypothetical protein [Candidatus Phytoplasma bonamiae]|uniref:Uncharacterized protein n=1 Tax=Candidatus Phytoplasma bonamiae TaxID=2982626 RepID=A0ABT9D418_9MOLU|nr:hypothetical protein ['Bonamia sp.' little leaf phytoplasma]MDO8064180.1 hypothetical protein ['Bonamia sp.' little leaf phytoplasma]MDV3174920.1 hypothetical protein ['Bonamia sp.' little leaf phytoplasma]
MIQLIVLPRTRLTTLIGRKKLVIYGLFNGIKYLSFFQAYKDHLKSFSIKYSVLNKNLNAE